MDSVSRVYGYIDNTRDLTLEAARDASNLRKTPPASASIPSVQLKKLLESKHEQEILAGLRRIIALTQKHSPDDVSYLLPTVLKNINSPNTHIRKLVYIFLLYNAESDQDTALLAINSIQKALSATDAHLRALALRTISSLKVPVIAQIVSLGIKRGAVDMSPIVRRTAAFAIPKCWNLDPSTTPQLETYLGQLLGDKQFFVAGAAVIAFNACCPERIDRIHPHYRVLVRMLVDMDEWSQLATLRMLTYYARLCFPQRTRRATKQSLMTSKSKSDSANFYDDPESEQAATDSATDGDGTHEIVDAYDPDLEILLKTAQALLSSRNPAVIVAVASMYSALTTSSASSGPSSHLLSTVGPLIALLRGDPSTISLALQNILQILVEYPQPFARYVRHFIVHTTDAPDVASLKLEALGLLYPHSPQHVQSLILAELTHATNSSTASLVRVSIAAIGRCAQAASPDSKTSRRCLRLLLSKVSEPPTISAETDKVASPALATSEALTQIRHIIQANPSAHVPTVIRLAKDLDTTKEPNARASIVWLVGEYAATDSDKDSATGQGMGNVAADVLRLLAKGFPNEEEVVKRQILILAAKVYLQHLNLTAPPTESDSTASNDESSTPERPDSQIPLLYAYIHHLTRYDISYTLRDLARTHRALLPAPSLSTAPTSVAASGPPSSAVTTQLATLLLNVPKPAPVQTSPSASRRGYRLGSATLAVGSAAGAHGLRGYEELPAWVQPGREPDARLRDGDETPGPSLRKAPVVGGADHARPAGAALDAAAENRPSKAPKTLDDWLDEDNAEGADEESEEEDESSEEEDESSEEEESDEDDEQETLVK